MKLAMKTFYYLRTLIAVILGLFVFASCSDSDDVDEPTGSTVDPTVEVKFETPSVTNNTIKYSWTAVDNVRNYTLQVSTDNTFATTAQEIFNYTLTDNSYTVDEDLFFNTQYYARVKANLQGGDASEWAYASAVTTQSAPDPTEVKVVSVLDDEIQGAKITFRFPRGYGFNVTAIDLYQILFEENDEGEEIEVGKEFDRTIELSEEDIENGYYVIDLRGTTTYEATIKGSEYTFNTVRFTTNFSPDVYLKLTEYISDITAELQSSIEYTLYLPEGYEMDLVRQGTTLEFEAKNLTIKSLISEGEGRAKISLNAQINTTSNIDLLRFEDIDFIGTLSEDRRLIQVTNPVTIESIEIVGCTFLDMKRGIIGFTNTASVTNNILFDDCILKWSEDAPEVNNIDGVLAAGNPGVNVGTSSADVKQFTFTNSTMINSTVALIGWCRTSTDGLNSLTGIRVTVGNCTFAGIDRVTNFIRFVSEDPVRVTMSNCIYSTLEGIESTTKNWFVANGSPTYKNIVVTNDIALGGTTMGFPVYGITAATRADFSGIELYPNQANDDFTISPDVYYDGKQVSTWGVGDPRWFPDGVEPAN